MAIVSAENFLALTNTPKDPEKYKALTEKCMRIIDEYISGVPIFQVLKDEAISFNKFRTHIQNEPNLLKLLESSTGLHKTALRERLLQRAFEQSETSESQTRFLLERMFPAEFGKRIEVTKNETTDLPDCVDDYIVDVERVDEPNE